MSRIRLLLAAAAVVGTLLPARAAAVFADTSSQAPTLDQLNAQLTTDQTRLTDLNDQVERAQADVDQLNHKLTTDQQRETEVGKQLAMMGKLEYEQPAFSLTSILEASSLQQLLSNIAQARLVANKQRNLLGQARQLRRQDQQTHDQMAARLTDVQSARDQAAQVAARTLALRNSAQDAALKPRATQVAAQAGATQTQPQVVQYTGSGPFPNHFSFGYCTYYVATRRYVPWFGDAGQWWPNARAYGYPEGSTPQVGAIMVTRESAIGHVAYVESVNGNTFTVSEMNYTAWNVVDRRTITLGGPVPIVGFIYGK
ncbi:MAG TPA: CHAP domain-containing protein [Candidatus Dormibacteraeota bacterium]|nr:CHAP domain-containing protein [Candidatus Dormibacteraeota bacterium]